MDPNSTRPARPPGPGAARRALKVVVGLAIAFVAGGLALYFWATSLNVAAAPAEPAENFVFRTAAFQVTLPRTFRLVNFVGLLQWPGERIRFSETAYAGPEEAARRFDEAVNAYQDWETGGQVVNVSRRFGRPAWLVVASSPEAAGGAGLSLRLAALFETGWVSFEQDGLLKAPPEKDAASFVEKRKALFLSRVWKFLRYYAWRGLAAEDDAEAPGFRTLYGRLSYKEDRPDYVYTAEAAEFEGRAGRFSVANVPAGVSPLRFSGRGWGRFKSFVGALCFKREVFRTRAAPRALSGRPGRELQILKRPLFESGPESFRVFWREDGEERDIYMLSLTGAEPGAALAAWRAITVTWAEIPPSAAAGD